MDESYESYSRATKMFLRKDLDFMLEVLVRTDVESYKVTDSTNFEIFILWNLYSQVDIPDSLVSLIVDCGSILY